MKWKINSLQYVSLMAFPIIGTIIGIGSQILFVNSSIDSYLSIIVEGVLGLFYLKMLFFVLNYRGDLSLFDISREILGKKVGNVCNFVLCLIGVVIATTSLFSISNFVSSQYLIRTPLFLVSVLLIIVVIFNVSKGFQVISRVGMVILFINFSLFFVAGIGLIPDIKMDNIMPFMGEGIGNVFKGGILLMFTNIIPSFLIGAVKMDRITDKEKVKKYGTFIYIFSLVICFCIIFLTVTALGKYLISMYQYPEYLVMQKISFMNFIDRIENLIAMQWIFGAVMYISIAIYFITEFAWHKEEDNPNRIVILISSILILILGNVCFKNNTLFDYFISNIYSFICMGAFVIITLLFLGILFKKKRVKTSNC